MSLDNAILLKLILDIAHYLLVPYMTLLAVNTLFSKVYWLNIPITFQTWVCTGILLYVFKFL